MKQYRGIGLMSGTSLDGVDLVLCNFYHQSSVWKFDIEAAQTYPYSEEWHNRLQALADTGAYEYAKANVDYGHYLGMLLRKFIIEQTPSGGSSSSVNIEYVASHGHTIFHRPERHFTAQIGDGETIATYLTQPLITNFRNKDVALGGEGAPLVPVGEKDLFYNVELFLNLGGIANISIISSQNSDFQLQSWKKNAHEYIAYDVCPCNLVLNFLSQKVGKSYDMNGELASKGTLIPDFLAYLESQPYYQLYPPRTLGREWVSKEIFSTISGENPVFGSSIPNLLFTFCSHIVQRIESELIRFGIKDSQILITGGGALNTFLMNQLEEMFNRHNIQLIKVSRKIIEYKEALIFAYLGLLTLLGKENTLKSITGARHASISGSIHLPAHSSAKTEALLNIFLKKNSSDN